MIKPVLPVLAICLMAATVAQAQMTGGGGHGHGGRGGGRQPGSSAPASTGDSTPAPRSKPTNQVDITGVVQAIDADAGRVTITYEPVEALNWPAGTTPFVVSKPTLLKDITVGEKVRFRIDSEQISELRPYVADQGGEGAVSAALRRYSSTTADINRP